MGDELLCSAIGNLENRRSHMGFKIRLAASVLGAGMITTLAAAPALAAAVVEDRAAAAAVAEAPASTLPIPAPVPAPAAAAAAVPGSACQVGVPMAGQNGFVPGTVSADGTTCIPRTPAQEVFGILGMPGVPCSAGVASSEGLYEGLAICPSQRALEATPVSR